MNDKDLQEKIINKVDKLRLLIDRVEETPIRHRMDDLLRRVYLQARDGNEDAAPVKQPEQKPVACVRSLTEQCAALVWERDELQKKVWQYEKHGVTCQLYGHKVERSCAECNEDENYAAPVRTKDLSDDEIEAIMVEQGDLRTTAFARAVIAADREKNRG